MFKYTRIFFLGVTFIFCKSVNGKYIIKKHTQLVINFTIHLTNKNF